MDTLPDYFEARDELFHHGFLMHGGKQWVHDSENHTGAHPCSSVTVLTLDDYIVLDHTNMYHLSHLLL
jgi:hypothetical protein